MAGRRAAQPRPLRNPAASRQCLRGVRAAVRAADESRTAGTLHPPPHAQPARAFRLSACDRRRAKPDLTTKIVFRARAVESRLTDCWTVAHADQRTFCAVRHGEKSFSYSHVPGSRLWPMDVHARESGSPMRSSSVAPTYESRTGDSLRPAEAGVRSILTLRGSRIATAANNRRA